MLESKVILKHYDSKLLWQTEKKTKYKKGQLAYQGMQLTFSDLVHPKNKCPV